MEVNNIVTHGLKGTVQNLTFVNSKRYGDHVRSPRGTFKPAVLNEAMENSKNRLLQVNQTAKLIFNSICHEHKDGTLWTRLLSRFRKQLKENNHLSEQCLLKLECHAQHTLQKMLLSHWDVEVTGITRSRMNITMDLPEPPHYRKRNIPYFQISMHVIYPDFEKVKLKKEVAYSEILNKTSYPQVIPFVVPVPAKATAYALFVKVTECEDGKTVSWSHTTGMRCVVAGIIERKQQQADQKSPTKRSTLVNKSSKRKTKTPKKK